MNVENNLEVIKCRIQEYLDTKSTYEECIRKLDEKIAELQKEYEEESKKRKIGIYMEFAYGELPSEIYALTYVGKNQVVLISKKTFTRWSDAVVVKDASNINQEEWSKITASQPSNFRKLSK